MILNNFSVPNTDLKVSVTTEFDSEELSGETSSTSVAHRGIKPKSVNATFLVKYSDSDRLTNFYRVAEAIDTNGDLLIYDITDQTANAANIRQVRFSVRIEQRELVNLKAWRLSFSLQEHLSVAEKTEQRLSKTNEQAVAGVDGAGSPGPLQQPKIQTGFEQVLEKVESAMR
ncbi:hypothetical protein MJO52_11765 [Microbulbifer variabilis]|uniref:Uncharacterized protein n=1 Tax=Microbulbifer variabilis TaxID=266805 RepID=A0ABY4V673_9GAMM|nr:hypothetical protein [Microbulbifer variabilis]USD19759.1 hypothetical protein MJO52_11765 [Microbulbifer variabilis]